MRHLLSFLIISLLSCQSVNAQSSSDEVRSIVQTTKTREAGLSESRDLRIERREVGDELS